MLLDRNQDINKTLILVLMNLLKSKLNEDAKKLIEHIVSDTIGTNILCDPFMMLVVARES